jgi:3,4-dihydroxyphenylacetate 2,3-dioxygenase
MAIPRSAYPPPFNVTRMSHVVLTVRDLARSRAFYVDALGFVVSEEEAGTLYLRGLEEACHHSIVLKQHSGEPRCERVGFRVYSDDDLVQAKDYFDRAGIAASWVEVLHQGRTLHLSDIAGTPLEICASMETRPRLVVQFDQFRAGCPHRIDHVQIQTPAVQVACAFYCALGFRLSEYVAVDNTDDLVAVFLQRKGNPHDIVFVTQTGPRLHHAAFTVPDTGHLLQACDHAGLHGFGTNVEHGPARHGPGHALFVYFRDPDGHRIELFTTHYQVMDIENEPVRWDTSRSRNRPWGFPPRQRWYEEATQFAGVEPRPLAQPANPMTLERYLQIR